MLIQSTIGVSRWLHREDMGKPQLPQLLQRSWVPASPVYSESSLLLRPFSSTTAFPSNQHPATSLTLSAFENQSIIARGPTFGLVLPAPTAKTGGAVTKITVFAPRAPQHRSLLGPHLGLYKPCSTSPPLRLARITLSLGLRPRTPRLVQVALQHGLGIPP